MKIEDPENTYIQRERDGLVDNRIAALMEAWDFAQFSDLADVSPAMKQVLREGLEAVHDHFYGKLKPTSVAFNYDLSIAPSGDLQLLTAGMTRRIGQISSVASAKEQGVIAWARVATRVRSEEIRLGHIAQPRN
jgi:hypothetical protein